MQIKRKNSSVLAKIRLHTTNTPFFPILHSCCNHYDIIMLLLCYYYVIIMLLLCYLYNRSITTVTSQNRIQEEKSTQKAISLAYFEKKQ